jgi:hypothetical protein
MHTSRVIGARVALGVALTVGLLFAEAELLAPDRGATLKTVYAADMTPSPTPTSSLGGARGFLPTPTLASKLASTSTPISTPVTATGPSALAASPTPTPAAATAPSPAATGPSPSQAASDQVATVAGQIAQIASDPNVSVEVKTTQINSLASQFNQLVAAWQQQAQTAGAQVAPNAPNGVQVATTQAAPTLPGATVTPVGTPTPALTGAPTADQLRAQIAQIAQQMGTVSQDDSLSADDKATQLDALATQFNQLTLQLQQLGG